MATMTERQVAYMDSLAQRIDSLTEGFDHEALRQARRAWTTRDASVAITGLKKMLEDARRASRQADSPPELRPGYYLHEGKAYQVVLSKRGTTYANVIDEEQGKYVYAKGAIYKLAGATPLTLEEAAQYGRLNARCIVCAHRIHRPETVRKGIGPVCEKRFAERTA